MPIALSTSWNAFRRQSAKDMLFEIERLGFRNIELNFSLTASRLKEIEKALRGTKLKVVSLHNFCPIPDELTPETAMPDCYAMSSPDSKERLLSVKYAKRSIDTALALGAKAVVLHCGRVEIPDKTRELIALLLKGPGNAVEFKRLKEDFVENRANKQGPFLKNTLLSLEELNKHAQKLGIFLGVETRFYYCEIPCLEEIGIILKEFRGSQIFYWHDAGHAQLMDNLGLARHSDFLELYAKDMLGIHLHDILNCQDHKPPSKGELNFSLFKPYLKKETIKVIEAHHPAPAEEIKESRELLESLYGES